MLLLLLYIVLKQDYTIDADTSVLYDLPEFVCIMLRSIRYIMRPQIPYYMSVCYIIL